MSKFEPAVPRRKYLSTEIAHPDRCPECRTLLEADHQTYYIAVRGNTGEPFPFVVGPEGGKFCPCCPVVVLDHEEFSHMARMAFEHQHPGETEIQFIVLGLVDLKQVPPDKRHLPFDEDNPLPTVSFLPRIQPRRMS